MKPLPFSRQRLLANVAMTLADDARVPNMVARHQQWLEGIRCRLPRNPLDELIDAFGASDVAELTGRTLRPRQTPRTAGGKYEAVAVSQATHERERMAFMTGAKRVAIISEACSTGISLHADALTPSAGKRRLHFCLEMAWGADKVLQQLGPCSSLSLFLLSMQSNSTHLSTPSITRKLQKPGADFIHPHTLLLSQFNLKKPGRTHRSNEASGPLYLFMASDRLGGDTRFVATVARRLQVLGAYT